MYLQSQVAQNNRSLYPKVAHYWFKVAQNYEPLALQVMPECFPQIPDSGTNSAGENLITRFLALSKKPVCGRCMVVMRETYYHPVNGNAQ